MSLVGLAIAAVACVPPGSRAVVQSGPTSCASHVSIDSTVYDSTQVGEQPIARVTPQLVYPAEAQRRKVQGRVVLTAVVNADGSIDSTSVTVTHSVDPLLDAEARRFVTGATLWPACREGVAVRERIHVPVVFSLGTPVPGARDGFLIGLAVGLGALMGAVMMGR